MKKNLVTNYVFAAVFLASIGLCDQGRSLSYNEQGAKAFAAKNYTAARQHFEAALSEDASNVTAAFNLAGLYIAEKDEAKAIELLKSYIIRSPLDAGLHARLGDAYFSSQKTNEAGLAYLKALELNPKYPGLRRKRATILILQKNVKEAIKELERVVSEEPTDHGSLANLANLFIANGDTDKAVAAAKRALQLKPDRDVYISLGAAYEFKGEISNAKIAYQKALDLKDTVEIREKLQELEKAPS